MTLYTLIAPEWKGQDGFILCGGTSITREMCKAVEGRNVLAVNSMYKWAPWAPAMFFADSRWWYREMEKCGDQLSVFRGAVYTIATNCRGHSNLRYLRRERPPKMLAKERDTVTMLRTSLSAALNIMAHKGVSRIYLLGADNSYGDANRAHCHTEHPWPRPKETWIVKTHELQQCVKPLEEAGIQVFNCSKTSTLPFWPHADLFEAVR
jgi:hypothetical protein